MLVPSQDDSCCLGLPSLDESCLGQLFLADSFCMGLLSHNDSVRPSGGCLLGVRVVRGCFS